MGIDKEESLLTAAAELRRHAEERLIAKTAKLPPPRTEDATLRLIHELEVHQIELEMQNEELRQARNEAETVLDKYTELYDFAPISYFTLDGDGTICAVNLTGASLFGIERARLLGQRFGLFVADEARPLFAEFLDKVFAMQGKVSCEVMLTKDENHPLFVQIEALADASGKECQIAVINITERKRAEAYRETGREVLKILNGPGDLQDSIQRVIDALRLRTGFDAVGIRLQDGNDFPYFAQKGFLQDFLLKENMLIGRAVDGGLCLDKDGNVPLECTCGLVISGKTDPAHPLLTPGGSFWTNDSFPLLDIPPDEDPRLHPRNNCIHQGYASVALVPIRSKDRVVGLIQLNDRCKGQLTLNTVELLEGIAAHMGEAMMRKKAEKELRKRERQLAEAQNMAHIGSWEWDSITDKITGSDEFTRILGLILSSYDSFHELIHPDDREMVNKAVGETFAHQAPYNVHYRIIRPDGITRVIHAQGVAQTGGDGKTVRMAGFVHDITERKCIEDALAEKQQKLEELNIFLETRIVEAVEELRQKDQMLIMRDRLAVMGEMINNIAHQWRQPLNTLGLVIQDVQLCYGSDEFSREFLEENTGEAMELIQHMSRTIDDFRNFFKSDKEIVAFSVNQVISRTLSLVEKSFSDQKIGITLHPEGEPMANGYPNEYAQVLLNILMNARDALVEHNVDDALISIRAFAEGGKTAVAISDNAGGIADEIMDKLFDAYFTTKGPDKGTGIGLFMSKAIIEKNMGGRLTVRNIGGGAEFRIEV